MKAFLESGVSVLVELPKYLPNPLLHQFSSVLRLDLETLPKRLWKLTRGNPRTNLRKRRKPMV